MKKEKKVSKIFDEMVGVDLVEEKHFLMLKNAREEFEGGDKSAILRVIYVCALRKIQIPDWAAYEFVLTYNKVINYQAKKWEDLFGNLYPKGTHIDQDRRKKEIAFELWSYGKFLHQVQQRAIDQHFFEDIGQKFFMSKTSAMNIYYEVDNLCRKMMFDENSTEEDIVNALFEMISLQKLPTSKEELLEKPDS